MFKQEERGRPSAKLSASLVILLMTAMVVAFAVPSRASAPGPYGGFASGSVAHLDALTIQGTRPLDFEAGVSNAAVDSEGLDALYSEYDRPIVPKAFKGKNSYGQTSILEAGLGVDKDTANQIAPFISEAATSGNPTHKIDDSGDAGVIPGDPLLWADLLHTVALANWNTDTCVLGEPISAAQSAAAKVQLVNTGTGTNSNGSFKEALAGLGAIETRSYEQLFKGKGDGLGLASVSATDAVHVALFQGTEMEVDIDVAPASLAVKVDGTPTAKDKAIEYQAPIATIKQGGELVAKLLPNEVGPVQITIPPDSDPQDADIVLDLKLGTLLPLYSSSGPTIKSLINAQGTEASASVNVLELSLLKIPEVPFKALTLGIGHLEAAAHVPAGGVDCPIPVSKSADTDVVESGNSFTTTIEIHNPWVCPLENVSLTDVITTEDASTFQITDTSPNADSPSIPTASGLTSATVKWNNLGTIAPGATKTVTVTLLAGGGAGKIKDTATAAGSVSNCKPAPGSSSTDVTGVTNIKVPVTGVGTLTVPETKVLAERLPKTGLGDKDWTWAGLTLLTLAAASGAVLRRRRHSNA